LPRSIARQSANDRHDPSDPARGRRSRHRHDQGVRAEHFSEARFIEDGFGADPAFDGFIAEEAEKPLGYLLHTPTYDSDLACRVLFVIDLWVRPWTRRLGVGRKLMETAAELGRQRNCGYLLWSVFKPNTLARQFYDKLGGQETA
jgi:ribosomal protein S18 acetylase RimI-like enzyme